MISITIHALFERRSVTNIEHCIILVLELSTWSITVAHQHSLSLFIRTGYPTQHIIAKMLLAKTMPVVCHIVMWWEVEWVDFIIASVIAKENNAS